MKQHQNGFGTFEGVLIVLILVLVGSAGWYLIDKLQSDKIYHVVGVQDYLCAQSRPTQCQGNLKVVTREGQQEVFRIDNKTKFVGSNESIEYQANQSPFDAKLERNGNYVFRLTIVK